MSNVNSDAKFGRSMDYSQLLELRRKYIQVNSATQQNPRNSPNIKPHFNQDKFNREGDTNGASPFYFQHSITGTYARVLAGLRH